MRRSPFRVLYRQFLFRIVDFESLSSGAESNRLVIQVAAFLAALSFMLARAAVRFGLSHLPPERLLIVAWTDEHFLISTTMVVAGLFAVLCWDSMFQDRRDMLVLAPLPVRSRTLFLAKLAALATALGVVVLAVNIFTGLTYPFLLGTLSGSGWMILRWLAAYWATMFAAGGFVLALVLAVQGLAAQLLPRWLLLRLSASLQLIAFCLFLGTYFLQPSPPLATPEALMATENQSMLAWVPSYWFLGLLQELNGSAHPALAPLERRAVAGLAVIGLCAAAALLLCYFRTLRKIVEEPDIVPGSRRVHWSPQFGGTLPTAVLQFTARTLLRSRQHRVILAGYLGIGFAIALMYLRSLVEGGTRDSVYAVNKPVLAASFVMMCFLIVGMRAVFTLPLALRANWIFRVTAVRRVPEYLAAIRRSLLLLAVAPAWGISAAVLFLIWPPQPVAGHLVVLALVGFLLTDLCLRSFQKIPFTCSCLPGKAGLHVRAVAYVTVLVALTDMCMQREVRALEGLSSYAALLAVLSIAALLAQRHTAALARSPDAILQFEEIPPTQIFALDLHRDGASLR